MRRLQLVRLPIHKRPLSNTNNNHHDAPRIATLENHAIASTHIAFVETTIST